jgi:hypothetical protein
MKIQLGIGSKKDLLEFINKGVDEFYIGIENIPGHLYGSNHIANLREVLEIIDIVHSNKKKLFVVANEVRGDLFNKTIKTIDELVHNQIDGIIIRDIAVLETLKKKNIKIYLILSSLALCFNKDCLKFYKGLGINRIALPEHITYQEAEPIINNKIGIDTEMFLTAREFCLVLNGFCYLKSFTDSCICRNAFISDDNKIFTLPRFAVSEHFKNIYNFHRSGCKTIKIGRGPRDFSNFALNETLFISKLLESNLRVDEFIKKAVDIHLKFTRLLLEWQKRLKKQ